MFQIEYRNGENEDWKIAFIGTTTGKNYARKFEAARGRYWRPSSGTRLSCARDGMPEKESGEWTRGGCVIRGRLLKACKECADNRCVLAVRGTAMREKGVFDEGDC